MSARTRIHLEDVEWLAESGCTWDEIESRIGSSRNSIDRSLRRNNRADIAARISRNGARFAGAA